MKNIALATLLGLLLPSAAFADFDLQSVDIRAELGRMRAAAAGMPTPAAQSVGACGGDCRIDSAVYDRVLHYSCYDAKISDKDARVIAAQAARSEIDVDVFLAAYRRTCDFDTAEEVGRGSRSGYMSAAVYDRVLYYSCYGGAKISDKGARVIAAQAARSEIDVDVFLAAYRRTCDFDSAVEVACTPKQ